MDYITLGFPDLHHLLEFAKTHVLWVGDAIQTLHPQLFPSPPAFYPSQLEGLSNDFTLRLSWPNYWSFIFSIITSNEYPGLIFFRIDWFDLLDVQGTLKSSSSTTVQRHSAIFIFQLSHTFKTAGKKKKHIALTLQTFVGKVMSMLFNILSRFLISFLQSRMCLLILCLQLLSIVILEPKKIVCHCCHCFPTYLPLSDWTRCHVLRFLKVEF